MSALIFNSDAVGFLAEMPAASVPLTVFSPPYDGVRDYSGVWSLDLPAVGKELHRVTMDGGVCCVVMQDGTKDFAKSLSTFRLAVDWCDNAGWRLFECCIYQRHGRSGAWWNKRFRVDHEYILIFLRGDRPRAFDKEHMKVPLIYPAAKWHGTDRLTDGSLRAVEPKAVNATKCRGTIWKYAGSNTEGNKLKMQHPATFPDALATDLIRCFSLPGDTVLDPMCGSGTTCVAALQNGRHSIGIDINEGYCVIARQRLSAA